MLEPIVIGLHLIVSAMLIGLVLLHSGKGGGLSDMFGGGVGATALGSAAAERNRWLASLTDSVQNVAVEMGGLGGHAENFAYVKLDRQMAEGNIVAARISEFKDGQLHASVLA